MITTRRRLEYATGYLALGMVRQAGAELRAIAEKDQLTPEVLGLRVYHALATRKWRLMADCARRLAEQDPTQSQWWIHWSYALREQEKVQAALEVAERGLDLHPEEGILHFNTACYLSLLGRNDEASAHLDSAIRLDERFQAESVSDPDLEGLWESFRDSKSP
jgi:tetratricopeptide (TPR) repeat protein